MFATKVSSLTKIHCFFHIFVWGKSIYFLREIFNTYNCIMFSLLELSCQGESDSLIKT